MGCEDSNGAKGAVAYCDCQPCIRDSIVVALIPNMVVPVVAVLVIAMAAMP